MKHNVYGRDQIRTRGKGKQIMESSMAVMTLKRTISVDWWGQKQTTVHGGVEGTRNGNKWNTLSKDLPVKKYGGQKPEKKKRSRAHLLCVRDLSTLIGKLGASEEGKVKNTGGRQGVTRTPKTTVRFLNPSTFAFGESILCHRGCSMHCRIFNSILAPNTHWTPTAFPTLSQIWQPKMSPDIAKCHLGKRGWQNLPGWEQMVQWQRSDNFK